MKTPKTLGEASPKINIVAPPASDGWILRRWAERWAKHLPADISTQAGSSHDVNFYVNYALYSSPSRALDVCYFTHREESGELASKFDWVAQACDVRIAQSTYTKEAILGLLDSKDEPEIVWPGLDAEFQRDKVVGVIGRDYPSGRKRYDWVDAIDIPGIEIRRYEDIPYEKMPGVYEEIDYLLVTSDREGGPMPVAEAIGMGVPVIMPDGVGWYSEIPCLTYGSLQELGVVLKGLSGWITWEESAERLRRVFNEIVI